MTPSVPQIRTAVADDAEDIRNVCEFGLGYPCETTLVKHRLENLQAGEEIVFVAEINGTVVGFVHADKYRCLYYETALNILGLAVLPAWQKQGLGTQLINAVEDWAKENQIHVIRLNSGASRTNAHRFYRSLGYDSEKEQLRFLKQIKSCFFV